MRAIKKIVALTTGAAMIGATVMGAMAADLSNYPSPFVEGCTFNGAIVVGEKAAAEDVVGAIDIASALAVSGTSSTTESSAGTTVSASGESIKIETSTKRLTLGPNYDQLSEVKSTAIDSEDLPTILADGTFKAKDGVEYAYEQKLDFNGATRLSFGEDSDYKDKENSIWIKVDRNANFVNYTLDFTKDVESDLSGQTMTDMEDSTINMLGKTYDISQARNLSTGVKLVMMGGAIKDILEQGQSKTYTLNDKEYEVEVTYIGTTSGASKVKFKVNGEVSDLMSVDDTWKTADGTTVGVREIMEEEAGEVTADQVEFYLGAEKLTLADSTTNVRDKADNVEISDEDVDGLFVDILATMGASKTTVDKIILSWFPDDELFITEEQSASMPGLGAFKVAYEGFTVPAEEEISVEPSGNQELVLKVPIQSGTATIPLLATNGTAAGAVFDAVGGEAADEHMVTAAGAGATIVFDRDTDQYFVASDSGAEASYLVEVTKIDDADGVTFKDTVSGSKYENKKAGTFTIGDVTLTVGNYSEGTQNVSITAAAAGYFDRVYSKEGMTMLLPVVTTPCAAAAASPLICLNASAPQTSFVLGLREEDRDDALYAGNWTNVTLGIAGTTSLKVEVSSVDTARFVGGNYYEIGDTDEFEGYVASDLATKVMYDTSPDQNDVKIVYHGGESYGNVFVADTHTTFGKVGAGQTTVCKVAVPPAMLDSEVTDVAAQDLIVVGGPCADKAAADVMGVANTIPECLAGFTEGKAMIKLYDTGAGKTAMLVAGATALDTRRASRVLANYADYALSGSEVEVTGTSLSDIQVSKVA